MYTQQGDVLGNRQVEGCIVLDSDAEKAWLGDGEVEKADFVNSDNTSIKHCNRGSLFEVELWRCAMELK